ncbi:NAD(P)/FAD-dependent oxidoreductase [Cohnella fermenti]|uniref:Monooxygenase n=1 Tax=Cohnella fermenti TaxID=2565925 RepID=A0A4V3WF94_9BACL|nr:NAD(P)/FAD-dependent oxidoreductase [Cohnella fermenti]THF79450.1 monooxygenase [Cohnella fermenti]
MTTFDCLVVGAGAAGIGIGCVLQDLNVQSFRILERGQVGASFRLWPPEMRMITPSFTSNAYGMLDLNAVTLNTSPAYSLNTEHPSGKQYAEYLQAVAKHKKLPIREGVDVSAVRPLPSGGFEVDTSDGTLRSRFVIWAAGEFQYPKLDAVAGAEHAIHTSLIPSWKDLDGDEFVIIGGYESGADAAINLAKLGKRATLIDRSGRWTRKGSSDPSVELSPYTKDRIHSLEEDRIRLMGQHDVRGIELTRAGKYRIRCVNSSGRETTVTSVTPPILATGFHGSLKLVEHLFERSAEGTPALTGHDESTMTPGLYLSGPAVKHGNLHFCFIYKFRQRFGVIADRIASKLGLDCTVLEEYRKQGFFLDDLSCCGENCEC